MKASVKWGKITIATHNGSVSTGIESLTIFVDGQFQRINASFTANPDGTYSITVGKDVGSVTLNGSSNRIIKMMVLPVSMFNTIVTPFLSSGQADSNTKEMETTPEALQQIMANTSSSDYTLTVAPNESGYIAIDICYGIIEADTEFASIDTTEGSSNP